MSRFWTLCMKESGVNSNESIASLMNGATLLGEQNGVKWYSKMVDRHNRIHIMVLPDQIIVGGWVSGKYVFTQLATLRGEQKDAFIRHLLA